MAHIRAIARFGPFVTGCTLHNILTVAMREASLAVNCGADEVEIGIFPDHNEFTPFVSLVYRPRYVGIPIIPYPGCQTHTIGMN